MAKRIMRCLADDEIESFSQQLEMQDWGSEEREGRRYNLESPQRLGDDIEVTWLEMGSSQAEAPGRSRF